MDVSTRAQPHGAQGSYVEKNAKWERKGAKMRHASPRTMQLRELSELSCSSAASMNRQITQNVNENKNKFFEEKKKIKIFLKLIL